jgi:N-acetylglucosamine kinase-like BadF-type ATPase
MPLFLGLDCGGSSSRALAVDESGEVVFQAQGGPANLVSTPAKKLENSLRQATLNCPPVDFVCGCFAGLLTKEDEERAKNYLSSLFPKAQIRATPDYAAALYASDEGTDVCVIAGTGSLVCSRGAQGIAKSGGRGYLLGDDGSAFQYGRAALMSYLAAPAKASPQLTSTIHKLFGKTEPEIVSRLYRAGSPQAGLAKLAKACGVDAAHGVAYAVEALETQSSALAHIVSGHIGQNLPGQSRLGICLAGGLWQTSGVYQETFMKELNQIANGIEFDVQRIQNPPVWGAARLAKEMVNGD